MQGVVFMPQNPQQGSPPPNGASVTDMEELPEVKQESSISQSFQSDSGIFSGNTTRCDNTDARSDCSSPERKYICPICDTVLTSQHEFTLHIRSHNNESEEQKSFACKICHKVLSSNSSLDRHVLVHSGERPFQCKHCGDTFTTNGNMHRHMRTHSNKESYESDGSTDSGSSKSIEFNNNKVDIKSSNKRKSEASEESNKRRDFRQDDDETSCFKCPVCERSDFNSVDNLDAHLEDNHPEYPAKCTSCKQVFSNNKLLNLHKSVAHESSPSKNSSILGFKDLTFVDFSSKKFPIIAKHECETNLHKVSGGLKFQCRKCARAFPCSTSLEIHESACVDARELKSHDPNVSEVDIRRAEFFSRLNLMQDEKVTKEDPVKLREHLVKAMDNTRDLADIQSILSNINLQKLHAKNDQKSPIVAKPSLDDSSKNEQDEESQDSFAIEFRKMKMRGEFPCRLCTAVFPNLRALKGHNRAHLNGNANGTYYCNMCPHSSVDKAALIRHMRTHNGDRPYECSLCNYAFTTKANCERHLRNRHSKTTREDVKKSIIYHPSEDPTNEDLNKLTLKEDGKKSLNTSNESNDSSPVKLHCSTPKVPADTKPDFPLKTTPLIPDLQTLQPSRFPNVDFIRNENIRNLKRSIPNFFPQPFNLMSPPENMTPSLQVKKLEQLKETVRVFPEFSAEPEEALDLSKKKADAEKEPMEEDIPQDLTKKSSPPLENRFPNSMNELLMKSPPRIDPAALYATHLAHLYRSGFPGWTGFPVNPLLFPTLPTLPAALPQSAQEIKERMQRFQLCGGSVISEPFPNIQPPMVAEMAATNQSVEKPPKEMTPLNLNVETSFGDGNVKLHSPGQQMSNQDPMQSPNSVKMVIKNGVLMPKQKQRRYRTERPFTCEHCSARFTLRSNMERHIKQQHPQYWSQRQRGGNVANPARKMSGIPMKNNFCDLNVPSFEMTKMYDYQETKEHISEKLKYAILAQQLRSNLGAKQAENGRKEEDEDCALVIDENEDANNQKESKNCSKSEEDLVPVSRLLDNASQQQFKQFFKRDPEDSEVGASEEDEEGLVAGGSTSEENISGTDENKSESETTAAAAPVKKKSAYSLAPNRVSCPYCSRKFPWTSSLRRHILTHTGQKPFKCSHCPLLFTTKSNCDRHLLRKHGNAATTITNESVNNTGGGGGGGANYLMRNVPERPFKCANCPSSTFSTYSNLKKHINCKHSTNAQGDDIKAQGYEAGSSEDEKAGNQTENKTEWDNQTVYNNKFAGETHHHHHQTVAQSMNSDLPFKCHLCEGSFGERHEALDHTRDKHASEYDLLMSKNALDTNATVPDETAHHDDDDNDVRGKFPDYSNRKVICAWCMRRFWSAEDLRRHMRTHTGERPFSCDICRRRFTLKHSMLRHRKKHNNVNGGGLDGGNVSDDEGEKKNATRSNDDADKTDAESDGNEGDLISNLLGIRDRSIIDRVLDATADDAAKLLGVKHQVK